MAMTKIILGIDPGLSGALSFYNGETLLVFDVPVFETTENKKKRRVVDCQGLLKILRENKSDIVYLENIHSFPGQSSQSTFKQGFTCGQIEMALAACNLPYVKVTPQKWKKAMDCPKEKDSARMRASQLLPDHAHNWDLKKHDGRAESALIALYGYRQ